MSRPTCKTVEAVLHFRPKSVGCNEEKVGNFFLMLTFFSASLYFYNTALLYYTIFRA